MRVRCPTQINSKKDTMNRSGLGYQRNEVNIPNYPETIVAGVQLVKGILFHVYTNNNPGGRAILQKLENIQTDITKM